ncbi:hypothetical protein AALP_AA2G172800 [Arabis alpina]|uniref:C2 domain-containing protein n=1 Tax=Arabis alpina TaxID=50452 RepID=A0A087HI41_ARAAL|nr:hypothetical protein AALP_AA2G172800 [Arabis alpina]
MSASSHKIRVFSLLIFSLYIHRVQGQSFVLKFSDDDFHSGFDNNSTNEYSDSDEFLQPESISEQDLDPGSWLPIFEQNDSALTSAGYYSGLQKILFAASEGNTMLMEEAVTELEASASIGDPHSQSLMGFVYGIGMIREKSGSKSFLQHQFAAEGGNMQSKMALAFRYIRLDMHEKAVQLYAEVAEAAVNSFLISQDFSMVEPIRIHRGTEENKNILRKFGEDFKILEYQAQIIGNPSAMYRVGMFYYFGMRGLRRDYAKAIYWFSKAVEKGELNSMVFLGDIYAPGGSAERNYTKAFECFALASEQGLYSAFNGLGYLYFNGYGVDKNYTKARECFEKVASREDPTGIYYLGMLYLKGVGVERDVKQATKYFLLAANAGLPKAIYQIAKMLHAGAELKNNLNMLKMAAAFYTLVAERGPWCSLSRWALKADVQGDVGKAFILYSRMSELGYEVAQSNAAWILDKYGERSMCIGVSGFCTAKERHDRAHSLWWRASEQGNDYAALLVGDAYYYGRGEERDFVRAAEAYMYAKCQLNAQAMFNLAYMHEYGQGLPFDLNLAKSYYDQALENEPASKLPIMLGLARLWIRRNYAHISIMVTLLLVSFTTFLHLRERRRRQVVIDPVGADVAQPLAGPLAFPGMSLMDNLLGILRVRVKRGINLAVRDVCSSDPYVVLKLGRQKLKTKVVKKNVNPKWEEDLTFTVTDPNLPLNLIVYDHDFFSKDDKMGDAEIDLKPYIEALRMELSGLPDGTIISTINPSRGNCLAEESYVRCINDRIIQNICLRLRNVERGEVEVELQWIDLPGSKGL